MLGQPLGLGAQPKRGGGQEVPHSGAAGASWGPWVHARGARVVGALTRDAFPCSGHDRPRVAPGTATCAWRRELCHQPALELRSLC